MKSLTAPPSPCHVGAPNVQPCSAGGPTTADAGDLLDLRLSPDHPVAAPPVLITHPHLTDADVRLWLRLALAADGHLLPPPDLTDLDSVASMARLTARGFLSQSGSTVYLHNGDGGTW